MQSSPEKISSIFVYSYDKSGSMRGKEMECVKNLYQKVVERPEIQKLEKYISSFARESSFTWEKDAGENEFTARGGTDTEIYLNYLHDKILTLDVDSVKICLFVADADDTIVDVDSLVKKYDFLRSERNFHGLFILVGNDTECSRALKQIFSSFEIFNVNEMEGDLQRIANACLSLLVNPTVKEKLKEDPAKGTKFEEGAPEDTPPVNDGMVKNEIQNELPKLEEENKDLEKGLGVINEAKEVARKIRDPDVTRAKLDFNNEEQCREKLEELKKQERELNEVVMKVNTVKVDRITQATGSDLLNELCLINGRLDGYDDILTQLTEDFKARKLLIINPLDARSQLAKAMGAEKNLRDRIKGSDSFKNLMLSFSKTLRNVKEKKLTKFLKINWKEWSGTFRKFLGLKDRNSELRDKIQKESALLKKKLKKISSLIGDLEVNLESFDDEDF